MEGSGRINETRYGVLYFMNQQPKEIATLKGQAVQGG